MAERKSSDSREGEIERRRLEELDKVLTKMVRRDAKTESWRGRRGGWFG